MEAGLEERMLMALQLVEEIDRQWRMFTSISRRESESQDRCACIAFRHHLTGTLGCDGLVEKGQR
jgi:hypothetical protein